MNCTAFSSCKGAVKVFLLITLCTERTGLSYAAQAIPQQVAQAAGQAALQAAQSQAQANAENFLQQHQIGIIKGVAILTTSGVFIAFAPVALPTIGAKVIVGLLLGIGTTELGDGTRKLYRWFFPLTPCQQSAVTTSTVFPTTQGTQPTVNVTIPNYPVAEFSTITYKITAVETDLRRFKRTTKHKFAQVDQRMNNLQQQIIFLAKVQLQDHQTISRLSGQQQRAPEALPSPNIVVEPVED